MAAPEVKKTYTAVVLDFETGGLDPKKHGVTQIGMQSIRLDTFEVMASYKSYIIPYEKIDFGVTKTVRKKKSKGLFDDEPNLMDYDWDMTEKYTGITEKICYDQGKELGVVVSEMVEFFQSAQMTKGRDCVPIIIGQNIRFDIGFLHQIFAFTKTKLKGVVAGSDGFYDFDPSTLDTIDLARLMFADNNKVTSYKLSLIAEMLDVDLYDAHDALADVEATGDIVRVLANKMRAVGGVIGDTDNKKIKQRDHWRF